MKLAFCYLVDKILLKVTVLAEKGNGWKQWKQNCLTFENAAENLCILSHIYRLLQKIVNIQAAAVKTFINLVTLPTFIIYLCWYLSLLCTTRQKEVFLKVSSCHHHYHTHWLSSSTPWLKTFLNNYQLHVYHSQAKRNCLWNIERGLHHDFLQRLQDQNLSTNVREQHNRLSLSIYHQQNRNNPL